MQKQFDNPPFTPFFRFVTVAELLVLSGFGLVGLAMLKAPYDKSS